MKDIETPGVYLMNIGDKVTITQGEQDVATLAKNAGVRAICLAFNVERPHSSLIGVSWDGDTAYVPLYKPGQDPAGEPLSLEPQFEPRYPEEESFSELEAC